MSRRALVSVRRGAAGDVARVAPLFDAYRVFYGASSDVAAARAFLAQRVERRESALLVAVAGDVVLGFAQLYPAFSSVGLASIYVLNDLFVTPEARGRGVGGLLLRAAAALARDDGALRVELATSHSNVGALRLYRANGYVLETAFAHLSLTLGGADDADV